MISATQVSMAFAASVSRAGGTIQAPDAAPPVLSRGRNPAVSAEDMALSYAGIAEASIGGINLAIQQYAYYKSDEYRQAINSESFRNSIDLLRQLHGDEAAAVVIAQMQPEAMMELERQNIEAAAGNIQGVFTVSGSLYSYDAATDTYGRGAFSLLARAEDFGVKVDSASGVQVSTNGKPFSSDFVRNYVPNAEFLPYKITDQKLFDIVA